MENRDLFCLETLIDDKKFYSFKLEQLTVNCLISNGKIIYNLNSAIKDIKPEIKKFLFDKLNYSYIEEFNKEFYVEEKYYLNSISWFLPSEFFAIKKIIFFINIFLKRKTL